MSGFRELLGSLPSPTPGAGAGGDNFTVTAIYSLFLGAFFIAFLVTVIVVVMKWRSRIRLAACCRMRGHQRVQNWRRMGPSRAPSLPPQPAPPLQPARAQPIQAWQPPQPSAQNIALVPLQGGDSSSSEGRQPPPQQIVAADAREEQKPPNCDSPCDEDQPTDAPEEQKPLLAVMDSQQPGAGDSRHSRNTDDDSANKQRLLLAARDSQQPSGDSHDEEHAPLDAADERKAFLTTDNEPLETGGDSEEQQPLLPAAGLPLDQQSDKEKSSTPSSRSVRQHKSSLPSFSTQQIPRTTRRAKTSTELGVDEERRVLLDCPEEQPLSDQPALASDDDGRYMRRQYGTSSLHSACETGPVSKSSTSSSDEDREVDTAL